MSLSDKEAINAVCCEEKYTWKDRLLNLANTIYLFFYRSQREHTVERRAAAAAIFHGSASAKHASGSSGSLEGCFAAWLTRSCPLPQCTR